MNYNGKERLEEITEPQIVEPPKKMYVWRNGYEQPLEDLVVAIVKRADGICAITFDGDCYVRFKTNEKAWEKVERKCRAKMEEYK